MTIRVHYYQPRDGIDVCKNCGAVRNRDAVGPRWCPGKPPAIETRSECVVPPPGWRCTRAAGHDGPCAAERESEAAKITRAKIEELRSALAVFSPPVEAYARDADADDWAVGSVGRGHWDIVDITEERARSIVALLNALPSLLDAADERDRLRALLVECKSALCSRARGMSFGYLDTIVERIEAELACGQAVVKRETPESE